MKNYLPNFVKKSIISSVKWANNQLNFQDENLIPKTNLEEKHLKNCKILSGRKELLESFPKGGVAAEVGVDQGEFTEQVLKYNNPKKLYLIDAWDFANYQEDKFQLVRNKFESKIVSGEVEIRRGYSTDELPEIPDNHLDWIYIDTDHSYSLTIKELRLSKAKIKENGIIAGHDFIAKKEMGFRYGVVDAVNQFCKEEDFEFIFMTHENHRHVSFAIRKI